MSVTAQMSAADLARRFSQLGQAERACQAYALALKDDNGKDPDLEMEGALYLLQFGGDYKAAYDAFLDLYRRNWCREDCLDILTEAFYLPNEKEMKARYEKNCRLLTKYDYCFRKDFLPFEDLPIRFYPYDQQGYLPFAHGEFGDYVNFNYEVISRNFFHDLEKPVLADDVYSQYELEYLNDNVRNSEWVGRENHIYLHYTDWAVFCSYLQVLEWRELLARKKIVLLFEDEIRQYPIDFKERFGIDYSQYPVKPVGIREVTRMIWHTQLSFHNGGDFFNEIFDAHPNLLAVNSQFMDDLEATVAGLHKDLKACHSLEDAQLVFEHWHNPRLVEELYHLKNRTDKDILVAMHMASGWSPCRDKDARIVPAIFFQPHFGLFRCGLEPREGGEVMLNMEEYDRVCSSKLLQGFKYIKTFSPMRRITTSYAASIKFMVNSKLVGALNDPAKPNAVIVKEEEKGEEKEKEPGIIINMPALYITNRSFMVDDDTRPFRDSVLVRFEDGKLNPKATFTALCAFLDLPYTESMTYCSDGGVKDPHSDNPDWYAGFSLTGVYKTYDEYAGDPERCYMEYFFRDAYAYFGYDFHYYDGKSMDEERLRDLTDHFDVFYGHARDSFHEKLRYDIQKSHEDTPLTDAEEEAIQVMSEGKIQSYKELNFLNGKLLMLRGLRFVNKNGRPLKMMKKLELDPALLEQPLYH